MASLRKRRENFIPTGLRNVESDSYWSKSDYRGSVQGSRLIVQTLVFPVGVPLVARWTSNEVGAATTFKQMLARQELAVTDTLLADDTFGSAQLVNLYGATGGWLLTAKQLPKNNYTWKADLFADRRKQSSCYFNASFKPLI